MKRTNFFKRSSGGFRLRCFPERKRRLGRKLTGVLLLVILIISPWPKSLFFPVVPYPPEESHRTGSSAPASQEESAKSAIKHYVVQSGDTLYAIFNALDLPVECLAQCEGACADFSELNQLQPEDELTIFIDQREQAPFKFIYSSVDGLTYTFFREGPGWACEKDDAQPLVSYRAASGTIADNLYDSCIRSQVPAALIMDLADLFAYDIDFNADIQRGDTFSLYYEEQTRNGKVIQSEPILAARMVIGGRSREAFFYELQDGYKGYFDEDGRSLQKLFLKAPLSYSRISSTFTYRRLHPILRIFRPHLGIDYAAPQGAPVSALGSGTITYLGRRGGFGRYIEVSHNATYKTAYGHLNGFAKGLRKGSKVLQGDVIGYVGTSGLATGPHLDFRFFKNGKPVNFLATDFPHARSIPKSLRSDFERKRQVYADALDGKRFAHSQKNNPLKEPELRQN